MSKEKIESLTRYVNDMKNRLTGAVPEKRKGHEESYYKFLNLEITKANRTLDKLKLAGGPAEGKK